jgi:hypothetical protein
MKKLLLLMCIACLTASVYSQPKLCLNGYSLQDAVTMRNLFIRNNTQETKTTCVWFDIKVISRMVDLMASEKGPNNEPIDGIRVYYGTAANNQNTVLLVSTYNTGKTDDYGITIHQDYFNHADSNVLFKTQGINGVPNNDGSSDGSAVLYSSCGTPCSIDRICNSPPGSLHYITRKHGEDMVQTLSIIASKFNTNCEWFPLCLFNIIDATKYDGIRIYYGKHPADDGPLHDRDTFVIELTQPYTIPGTHTTISKDIFDCTYAQCDTGGMDFQIKKYFPKYQIISKKHGVIKEIEDFKTFILVNGFDNGEICPTHCTGLTLPTDPTL